MSRSNQIPLMGNCCSAEDNTSVLPPDPKTSTFKKGTRVHWTGLGELRAHPTTQNTALAPRPAAEATTTIAVLDGSNDGIGAAPVESGSRVLVTMAVDNNYPIYLSTTCPGGKYNPKKSSSIVFPLSNASTL
ncbi:hypothetical protein EYC84_012044 [Monilinia fructicola]|uniref:Uncharacterized protein n=1 Tax=Monilinia fructicola TaxID=38448 RepID=A0A5M9J890_MONFR|nr:hypothetical protein EYC84_012044 [Monilinia fructicola]